MTSGEYRQHLPLVELVARRVHARYGHIRPGPDFEDLMSFGSKGLIEAAGRFDPARNVSFRTFAYRRIHGAMIDGIRQMGAFSRREVQRHRVAPDFSFTFVELDESVSANRTDDLGDQVDRQATVHAALRLLDGMPEAKRSLVRSYFFEGLQLHEIGARRGQSKSWMCRLLAKALSELREGLGSDFPEFAAPARSVA